VDAINNGLQEIAGSGLPNKEDSGRLSGQRPDGGLGTLEEDQRGEERGRQKIIEGRAERGRIEGKTGKEDTFVVVTRLMGYQAE
jgi:hypothetical protein